MIILITYNQFESIFKSEHRKIFRTRGNFHMWLSRATSNHPSVHQYHDIPLHKKWGFPLTISSVNVTKSTGNCRFGHIYWRNPRWKTSFFVQCMVCYFSLRDASKFLILAILMVPLKDYQLHLQYFCRFWHNFYKVSCL